MYFCFAFFRHAGLSVIRVTGFDFENCVCLFSGTTECDVFRQVV